MLPPWPELPPLLQTLFTANTEEAVHFRKNIRAYNTALTFTPMKCKEDDRVRGGIKSFAIQGQMYHYTGGLRPLDENRPSFAQLYFYDPHIAAQCRVQAFPTLRQDLLLRLEQLIRDSNNPFIAIYMTAREQFETQSRHAGAFRVLLNPRLELIMEQGSDQRRTNLPTSDEIGLIVPDEYEGRSFRDIVLAQRREDGSIPYLQSVHHANPAYLPLHYVLFYPSGQPGWHWSLRMQNAEGNRQKIRISERAFHRYHLFPRTTQFNPVLHGDRLLQQYLVDAWAQIEQGQLDFLRYNQKTIRADLYQNLEDAVARNDFDGQERGRRIVLPSSFANGDRFMHKLYQNSMAIVRHFGKPTLFITFTANPNWDEIKQAMSANQKPVDRPEIVATVFHLKLQALLKDLKMIYGKFLGTVWTIEYQKRGLPHCHILLFLDKDYSFVERGIVDQGVCAELPTPDQDPDGKLYDIVGQNMMHGPCGELNSRAPCMDKNVRGNVSHCTKGYPRAWQETTQVESDGYPLYKRMPGRTYTKWVNGVPVELDNRWVVPYSPYLSRRYEAHINVEICSSIHAIKYVHKYVYKGVDRTTARITTRNQNQQQDDFIHSIIDQDPMERDEINEYVSGRYISPSQAAWHIFEFKSHCEQPPVMFLGLHLSGQQPVYYRDEPITAVEMINNLNNADTPLTAWFQYNARFEDGRHILYQEFSTHYVYDVKKEQRC